ncbi:hypothetical protein HMPREF0658_0931, partial [Hoylesella marshii DSM 16973 = JCM 13450]
RHRLINPNFTNQKTTIINTRTANTKKAPQKQNKKTIHKQYNQHKDRKLSRKRGMKLSSHYTSYTFFY